MVKFPSLVKVLLVSATMCCVTVPAAQAQSDGANEIAYHTLLQQIADKKISLAQQQVFLAGQEEKIADLNKQLDGIEDLKASVVPMIEKMTAGIEAEIKADFPFKRDMRMARLASLKDTVDDAAASVGEKYRKALSIYRIEVAYGQNMEAYPGNHPLTPTVREGDDQYKKDENGEIVINEKTGLPVELFDGSYLRYGRTALVYVNEDGSGALRYDLASGEWKDDLPKSKVVEIRRAIRISKGQVAPGVVMAPIQTMP
ncbi:MAG TPA: DUF3450 domain-containing protein [Gammaproteobacteria bacterium]|nr:DUF3450 domain-containing protein [Gammaproteobacteria bacterium]